MNVCGLAAICAEHDRLESRYCGGIGEVHVVAIEIRLLFFSLSFLFKENTSTALTHFRNNPKTVLSTLFLPPIAILMEKLFFIIIV